LAISSAKILIYFSNKIYVSKFIKQHSETGIVWYYQNADCSLRKKVHRVICCNFDTFVPLLSLNPAPSVAPIESPRYGGPSLLLSACRFSWVRFVRLWTSLYADGFGLGWETQLSSGLTWIACRVIIFVAVSHAGVAHARASPDESISTTTGVTARQAVRNLLHFSLLRTRAIEYMTFWTERLQKTVR